MEYIASLSPKDIANLILVLLFWLFPTMFGIASLIYFYIRYRKPYVTNNQLDLGLLVINFINCLWGWTTLFLFIMLLWGAPVTETFIWIGLIFQGFCIYVIPFINLAIYIKLRKSIIRKEKP